MLCMVVFLLARRGRVAFERKEVQVVAGFPVGGGCPGPGCAPGMSNGAVIRPSCEPCDCLSSSN